MITPFKLDPKVVSVYRTAPAVRSVVHRMADSKPQADFTYHGKSKVGGITEHRIREIQELGDLGTPYTNAAWHFSHHSSEAITELDSQISGWDFMSKHLGREDVFRRVGGFMTRTRKRILPACFAIHEADTDGQAQKSYQDMYERWMEHCAKKSQSYREEKMCSSQAQKRSIRQAEIAAAKEILEGFRGDLSFWVNEVHAQIQ